MADSPMTPLPAVGYAPARHQVGTIHRDREEIRVALLTHDTGLQGIRLSTWRPGPDGSLIEDPSRRLTLRMGEIEAPVGLLRAAVVAAPTVERPAAPAAPTMLELGAGALDYGPTRKDGGSDDGRGTVHGTEQGRGAPYPPRL